MQVRQALHIPDTLPYWVDCKLVTLFAWNANKIFSDDINEIYYHQQNNDTGPVFDSIINSGVIKIEEILRGEKFFQDIPFDPFCSTAMLTWRATLWEINGSSRGWRTETMLVWRFMIFFSIVFQIPATIAYRNWDYTRAKGVSNLQHFRFRNPC